MHLLVHSTNAHHSGTVIPDCSQEPGTLVLSQAASRSWDLESQAEAKS